MKTSMVIELAIIKLANKNKFNASEMLDSNDVQ